MKKICVCIGSRAEKGLTAPIRRRIENSSSLELQTLNIQGYSFLEAYKHAEAHIFYKKPDLMFIPCDRYESFAVAVAAYYKNVPICHFHAGDISEGTWDDNVRHAISLLAQLHFCNGGKSATRVMRLLRSVGRKPNHVYDVGSTAFDDLKIDESLCPKEPYDLVLYNPPTRKPELMLKELCNLTNVLDKHVLWLEPNGDLGSEDIKYFVLDLRAHAPVPIDFLYSLERPKFLGLLKNCDRFIGNSSAILYEAPYFKTKCVHIGIRNKGREPVKIRVGGSERIVRVLERLDLR